MFYLMFFLEPFFVTNPVDDSIVIIKVFRSCPLSLFNRVIWVYFVELNIIDSNIILGMELLHGCFTYIDSRT